MTCPSIDAVAMDLHPAYETGLIAKRFVEEFEVPLFKIQHHWAHGMSLLKDNNLDEGIVLSLDGLGYGDDGTLWGGEILHCSSTSYHRIGHLQPIPLPGGDKATEDPRRLVFALLDMFAKERFFTGQRATFLRQLMKQAPLTSSFARILDAVSCLLGICEVRTYDGEPAMKLEPYLAEGKPVYEFDVNVTNKVIDTPSLFNQLDELIKQQMKRKGKANLAHSFVRSLIETMADISIDYAQDHAIDRIGITGGVSYNIPIVNMLYDKLKRNGFDLFVHNSIPNGDGGIAIGQNLIASTLHSSK
jgi:hydrogenase maturation protein HypF